MNYILNNNSNRTSFAFIIPFQRTESQNRSNTPEQNLALWVEMKSGTEKGLKCCVRAKMDMKSDNGCMRDPTMYRCKLEPHITTGTKYKGLFSLGRVRNEDGGGGVGWSLVRFQRHEVEQRHVSLLKYHSWSSSDVRKGRKRKW